MADKALIEKLKSLGNKKPDAQRGLSSFLFKLTPDTKSTSGLSLLINTDDLSIVELPTHGVLSRGYWELYTGDATASDMVALLSK